MHLKEFICSNTSYPLKAYNKGKENVIISFSLNEIRFQNIHFGGSQMEAFLLGFNWGDWGLLLVGFLIWGMIIASGLFFLRAIWKKSWKSYVYSGLFFLIPSVMLFTQPGYTRLFILLPILAFILALYTKSKR